MKRLHSGDSNLDPYHTRNSSSQKKQAALPSQRTGPDLVISIPFEVISLIFTHLPVNKLNSIATVCKHWHTVTLSETFGTQLILKAGIPSKPGQSCLKTYQLWLKNITYILLDCSESMDTSHFSPKAIELVKKLAQEVFDKQWVRGVRLGIFSDTYKMQTFYNINALDRHLKRLKDYIKENNMRNTSTNVIPLLDHCYDFKKFLTGSNKVPESEVFMHLISDCAVHQPVEVNAWIQKKLKAEPAPAFTFHIYWLKDKHSFPNVFTKKMQELQKAQKEGDLFKIYMHETLVTKEKTS